MPEHPDAFDTDSFAKALDAQRAHRDLTWRQVAEQSGVSPSTLTRLTQGRNGSVESVAVLASWGGLCLDDYVARDRPPADRFAPPKIQAALSADANITLESAQVIGEVARVLYQHLRTG